jgi:hypothetical protein
MTEIFDLRGKKICIADETNGVIIKKYRAEVTIVAMSVGNHITIDHGGAVTRITRDTPTSFKIERSLHGDTQAEVKTK